MTRTAARAVRVAVTMGDPAGIGPEIVAKALRQFTLDAADCAVTCYGDPRVWRHAGVPAEFPVVAAGEFDPERDTIGCGSARSGDAAARALFAAIGAARAGEIDGIVTAPLSKEALQLAGHRYPGQTEILAELSGAARAVMLFVGGGLRIALATRHIALRDVAARLDPLAIAADLVILDRALRREFGISSPRIAVCGLNPHAGEHGLFGDEESTILRPGLAAARERGVNATDPLPADTLFVKLRRGEFDAALAMYHDQGLVPMKLLAFGGGVNVSLGLDFVRTSPDHGTAYDIAGQDRADPASFLEALRLAADLGRRRATA